MNPIIIDNINNTRSIGGRPAPRQYVLTLVNTSYKVIEASDAEGAMRKLKKFHRLPVGTEITHVELVDK